MPAQRATRVVEGPLHAIRNLWERMVAGRKLAAAALREIFDESAYERFLTRQQLPPGVAAYSQFCREREKIKVGPSRCC